MHILTSSELPFQVSEDVATSIDGYVAAVERNDLNIDLYECDVWQASRSLPEDQEAWVQKYYCGREYINDPQGLTVNEILDRS